jgi:hypothetical protein
MRWSSGTRPALEPLAPTVRHPSPSRSFLKGEFSEIKIFEYFFAPAPTLKENVGTENKFI